MDHSDKFLLTVHGANSKNEGFTALRNRCEKDLPGIMIFNEYYGDVLPFWNLTEMMQEMIFTRLRDRLELIRSQHLKPENRRLFIVAHSFGTQAVLEAIQMHVRHLHIEALILLGSIIRRSYRWDHLVESGVIESAPLAIVRPFDLVVRKARLIGGGESGADGFIANGMHVPTEIWKNGGHTSYDPDDFDDIIAVIQDGVTAIPKKDRGTWYEEQGILRRGLLKMLKLSL